MEWRCSVNSENKSWQENRLDRLDAPKKVRMEVINCGHSIRNRSGHHRRFSVRLVQHMLQQNLDVLDDGDQMVLHLHSPQPLPSRKFEFVVVGRIDEDAVGQVLPPMIPMCRLAVSFVHGRSSST